MFSALSETRKCASLTLASAHSGSKVCKRNRMNPSGSEEGGGKEIKMLKNDVAGHKLNVEAIIKNMNTISLELKKMKELSQLLLCDLTLQFNHPGKPEDLKETVGNSSPLEELKVSDVSLASNTSP
ncbi:putative uncharacterized protein C5orf58 homolog isoform X2 [Artibeus jamaicensis]|uniref:putative uncharacterized protein C5orf58 homolog isoform X2 n=1 Tax=Artibeus jamaicensis TaxID=9417 RepID=UPI00235B0A78|nr:putative uncharacterized protein C5orf58 homolog isoform X2 [Artibeus jamaicensis]XP_036983833.2 putative uncharacterized protein C5orf58 homolog isoform X2 [Artibeus jamaicensis]XP_036983836.2 putative uncharacterized protein C5orf58 homolog isoform X2 [Artibeus jamaicensis]XP_036983837.2 putative uncharacterized protein C5orf58 homolog isoform X2 [Artibeus jamaicensis]XP_053512954.1 putative uncharacterized protein C5orf58 homolog isoform X2 [Artibeus jamaicensis]